MINIQQSKFSKISNLIFLTITTFSISFIWINFYIKNIKYSFISSIIISLCFFTIYLVFQFFKNKIYLKADNLTRQLDNLKNYLLYSNYNDIIETISKAYQLDNLTKTNNNYHYIDSINQKDIYLLFDKEIIAEEDFIIVQKSKIYNNIEVYCIHYTPTKNILKTVSLNIQSIEQINQVLIKNNINIKNDIELSKTAKYKVKEVFSIILNRSKSRSYCLWGFILIILSLFTTYYLYYNIVGSILLLLSIYSRFNKRFN